MKTPQITPRQQQIYDCWLGNGQKFKATAKILGIQPEKVRQAIAAVQYKQPKAEAMYTKTVTIYDPLFDNQYIAGDKYYLVETFDERQPAKRFHGLFSESHTPMTNRGEAKAEGWLGCTDGINQTALGLFEVVDSSIEPSSATRLTLKYCGAKEKINEFH